MSRFTVLMYIVFLTNMIPSEIFLFNADIAALLTC